MGWVDTFDSATERSHCAHHYARVLSVRILLFVYYRDVIPKTKQLVMGVSILGVLALVGIGTRQPSVEAPLRASEYAPALVRASIDAPPEVLAEVLVETPTLRADTRAHLRETLSTYVSEHQGVRSSDDVAPQSEVTTPASLPRGEHPEQSVKWCDTPEGAAVPSIEPWGPVRVFEGEGARVERTLREQADGTA